ncbi:MAG: TonB-dependent receptor plug domain-containing protein [Opitutaceae bacterium]|nr:TonB-dependent receptor plug domain-containing protein [Opitutaceae bacterium]
MNVFLRPTRRIFRLSLSSLFLLAAQVCFSVEAKRRFDIPAGKAETTLRRFADQSGAQFFYAHEKVSGTRTNAVKGELTPHEALDLMLSKTALVAVHDERTGAYTIGREVSVEDAEKKGASRPDTTRAAETRHSLPTRRVALSEGSETVTLNPFEVNEDSDTSYGALNSNSLTGFSAKLESLPMSADILTETFMKDVAETQIESLIGTYVAGADTRGNNTDSGTSSNIQPLDRSNRITLRGLASAVVVVDGFLPPSRAGSGLSLSFTYERAEVIMGPQSLLYGRGGPGGVINLRSKQARLNRPAFATADFRIDSDGHKLAQLDFGFSKGKFAFRGAVMDQDVGSYREDIGGPARGYYLQAAWQPFANTTIRVSGQYTDLDRYINTGHLSLNAGSTAVDSRHGQSLQYLLATDQMIASKSGPSGAGHIGNGNITWENVDSLQGWWKKERTKASGTQLNIETQWTRSLSSQLSLGYQDTEDRYTGTTLTFFSPNAPSNLLPGHWSVTHANGHGQQEPRKVKGIRYTLLADSTFLGGRARNQAIFGAEYNRIDSGLIAYNYFRADSNFNLLVVPGQANSGLSTNGRTAISPFAWAVDNGPVNEPAFRPWEPQVTYNGVNYVNQVSNPPNAALASPANPHGVTLGGQQYTQTALLNRGVFGVALTEWMNGRLNTLAGVRYGGIYRRTVNQSGPVVVVETPNAVSYNAGITAKLSRWLVPYIAYSNTHGEGSNNLDPYGEELKTSNAVGYEAGLKIANAENSLSGSIAYYGVQTEDENWTINGNFTNAINPAGLNGRLGVPGNVVPIERRSRGAQLVLTASPTPGWRLRLSAALIKGTVGSTNSYAQVYNDQFYSNSAGQVTYRDGSPVYVTPTFSATTPVASATTPGAIPLTIAMMNTPGVYYATPTALSGAIGTNTNVARVLRVVDPVRGPILTGAVGLPISSIQINPGFTPPGSILVTQAGDATVGYPEVSMNLSNAYSFRSGRFKGLTFGGTVGLAWDRNMYNYYVSSVAPGVPRKLFRQPTMVRFDPMMSYRMKFSRFTWSMQVNVNNLFNRYKVLVLPNPTTGWTGVLDATIDQVPRTYVFSTGVDF